MTPEKLRDVARDADGRDEADHPEQHGGQLHRVEGDTVHRRGHPCGPCALEPAP